MSEKKILNFENMIIRCFIVLIMCGQYAIAQIENDLPDCNCRKEGECIQYLDSMLSPTKKKKAVYMRYNYQLVGFFNLLKGCVLEGNFKTKDHYVDIKGRTAQKDTIVFLNGMYRFKEKKSSYITEYYYENGYITKIIYYNFPKPGYTDILIFNTESENRWNYTWKYHNENGKLYLKQYYCIENRSRICREERYDN